MTALIDLDPKEYVGTLDLLKKINFLSTVPEEILKSLLFSIQKTSVAKDKKLIFQGEISNCLYIIRGGSVVITTRNKGNKIQLAELSSPSYFGEISLLRPTAATATVTAGDNGADLLVLAFETMAALSKKHPDIVAQIQTVIESRLAERQKARQADDDGDGKS